MQTKLTSLFARHSLLALMCLMTHFLYGQTQNALFTPIKLPNELSEKQMTMVKKIEKYPNVTQVQYVTVNDYTQFVEGSQLVLTLPNEVNPVHAKIRRSEISENGNFALYAIFENGLGEITLLKEEEKVFGSLSCGDFIYRIVGLGKDLSALMTMNTNRPLGRCGHEDGKDAGHTTTSEPASTPEFINHNPNDCSFKHQ